MHSPVQQRLEQGDALRTRGSVPLSSLTTLQLGGPAKTLIDLDHVDDWGDVVEFTKRHGARPLVLGRGSNVLAADSGCSEPVVRMATSGLTWHKDSDEYVRIEAQAGHLLADLVAQLIDDGVGGMETLSGIPGTVGATPIQNVGAYGQEIADTFESAMAWDWVAGRMVHLDSAACAFGHRSSIFKRSTRFTILTVTLRLLRTELSAPLGYQAVCDELGVPRGTRVPLGEAARAVLSVRRGKGMVLDPGETEDRSVGSVFLSPVISSEMAVTLRRTKAPVNEFSDGTTRVSASWLIKQAGFALGQRLAPGVRMSRKHFTIVADEGATAAAFAAASQTVAADVLRATGVQLTPEPDLFGDEPVYRELLEAALSASTR